MGLASTKADGIGVLEKKHEDCEGCDRRCGLFAKSLCTRWGPSTNAGSKGEGG